MNNKKFLLIILFLIYLFTFLYLIDDVEIEFVGVSRYKYQEFKLNCGSIYDILINNIEYSEKNLRMNEVVCRNTAVVKILNSFLIFISSIIFFITGIKYLNSRTEREDISDLLKLLKRRNNKKL
jgi:hypothetical protein|tara:strand:+ start:524 stop:895 length:372 start_codon:yes stop_codon:yes gene_type:complete